MWGCRSSLRDANRCSRATVTWMAETLTPDEAAAARGSGEQLCGARRRQVPGGVRLRAGRRPARRRSRRSARAIDEGERFQTLLGITGSGKSATIAWTIEQTQRPDADPRPQQVARRPARPGDARVLPRQPRRVLRQLLRLLPARGVHPVERHLHREGQLDQRRDRPAAPLGHRRAAHPARRDRGRLGVVHLRHGQPRRVPGQPARPVASASTTTCATSCAASSTCSTTATT